MKKMLKKTNLSAQNDYLHTYVNKKVIFKVKEGKLLGGNMILSMDIFLFPKREIELHMYFQVCKYSAEYRSRVGTL